MYNYYNPYYRYSPMYNNFRKQHYYENMPMNYMMHQQQMKLQDYGKQPFVIDIEKATIQNDNFRTALWTGDNLQVTLMSIEPNGEIGLEAHPNLDQFIRIEQGQGLVLMGDTKENLDYRMPVRDDFAIIIPAGKYHNLINTGNTPIKLYSIYAPPEHPYNTVHKTKADADAAEENHMHT